MELVGPTRVLYGSDAPFHHPLVEILKVRLSGLDEEGIERVLRTNALELFLPDRDRGAAA
jgi:predicted TIM-barrel fold metal-dependent hydrolase